MVEDFRFLPFPVKHPRPGVRNVEQFEKRFYGAVGALTRLKCWSQTFGRRWSRAQRSAQLVFT